MLAFLMNMAILVGGEAQDLIVAEDGRGTFGGSSDSYLEPYILQLVQILRIVNTGINPLYSTTDL